ncbi:MAG: ATP-dependent Clp protease ATP-binding subunit, partial [Candidatus Omnitrophica bacterium]|nr:ATP-dependent Clp protease ATP-binding subunit [Candidatus Omnitrophota bacterium]
RAALKRREQRSVMLTGPAGVGKSHLMSSYVKREVEEFHTDNLYFQVDTRKLASMMSPQQAAFILGAMIRFANRKNIAIFIDEAHEVTGIDIQGTNFFDLIKEPMAEGDQQLRFYLGTTTQEAGKYFQGQEAKANLRRMKELRLAPLSQLDIKMIIESELKKMKKRWDREHPEAPLEIEPGLAAVIADMRERLFPSAASPAAELNLADSLYAYLAEKYKDSRAFLTRGPTEIADALNDWLNTNRGYGEIKGEPTPAQSRYNVENRPELAKILFGLMPRVEFAKARKAGVPQAEAGETAAVPMVLDTAVLLEMLEKVENIPPSTLNFDPDRSLAVLRISLKKLIIGQDTAVDQFVDGLKSYYALKKKSGTRKPFFALAAGLSSVGKTQFGIELAKLLFGENRHKLLTLSSFALEHTVATLLGSPPGYKDSEKDGLLKQHYDALKSGGVEILDEAEKAHLSLFNVFLELFDEKGETRDMKDNRIVYSNIIAWMTSNLGVSDLDPSQKSAHADAVQRMYKKLVDENAGDDALYDAVNVYVGSLVSQAITQFFRPEFLNRQFLRSFLYFAWLHPDDARRLVDEKWLPDFIQQQRDKGVKVDFQTDDQDYIHKIRFGRFLRFFGQAGALDLADVLVDDQDDVYVLDRSGSRIVRVFNQSEISEIIPLPIQGILKVSPVMRDGERKWLVASQSGLALVNVKGQIEQEVSLPGVRDAAFDDGWLVLLLENRVVTFNTSNLKQQTEAALDSVKPWNSISLYKDKAALTDGKEIWTLDLSAKKNQAQLFASDPDGIASMVYDGTGRIVYTTVRKGKNQKWTVSNDLEVVKKLQAEKDKQLGQEKLRFGNVMSMAREDNKPTLYFVPVASDAVEDYQKKKT